MSDRDLAIENREIWRWIKENGHDDFVALAKECDDFVRGEQWPEEVKQKLRKKRKPALTLNMILPVYAVLYGEMLNRRSDISFRPSSGGDISTARVLDKLWMFFTNTQQYNFIEGLVFVDGIIRGRGFFDLRVTFNDSVQAEPVIQYVNSKDVGLYPGDSGYDPDYWTGVMVTKWLSPLEIAELFKVDVDEVVNQAEGDDISPDFVDWRRDSFGSPIYSDKYIFDEKMRRKYRLYRVLERQEWTYKTRPCFVDPNTGEVREIPENWDNERINAALIEHNYQIVDRKVKKIDWVVSVGNLLLHKSISPYKHFTIIPYFPFLIGGRPVGIVEHLRDPQNLLNKTISQELHIVAGIANSGFKVRTGALANMTPEQLQERGGEDGLVIEVTGDLNAVEKLQPNQVPTGLDRLSFLAGDLIQRISLVSDSLQGLNRPDEAAAAIQQKAFLGSKALTPIYESLNRSRRIVARNWLDLVQSFVTEERVYYITSRDRFGSTEKVVVNQPQFDGTFLNDLTVGEYQIVITNVQERTSADLEQFDILMQMLRMGAPIPWSDVVSNLTVLENREELVNLLRQQEGRMDPTKDDLEQRELQKRLLMAQAADKESTAFVKLAQAQKALSQSQQNQQEDQRAKDEALIKAQLAQQRMQLELQMAQARLEFDRQKMAMELRQAEERHQLEMEKLRAEIEKLRQQQIQQQQSMLNEAIYAVENNQTT